MIKFLFALIVMISFNSANSQIMTKKQADTYQFGPSLSFMTFSLIDQKDQNFLEEVKLFGATSFAVGVSVKALKNLIKAERPNHSSFQSFPSGHTAISFMGAEMIRMKYPKKVHLWLPNYLIAAAVGIERVQSNNHRPLEVISGAIIAIAEVHIVNKIQKRFKTKRALKKLKF